MALLYLPILLTNILIGLNERPEVCVDPDDGGQPQEGEQVDHVGAQQG